MYNLYKEKKVKLQQISKRKRWLYSRKAWINKIELKHNNDNVTINVHIYDRMYNILRKRFNYLLTYYPSTVVLQQLKGALEANLDNMTKLLSKIEKIMQNKSKSIRLYLSNNIEIEKDTRNALIEKNKKMNKIVDNIVKRKKKLLRQIIFLYYVRYLSSTILKYKSVYITYVQKLISRLYNKKVTFNIILLKNYYLNSNILTQILAHKSKDRNNRIYKTLKNSLINIKVPIFRKSIINKAKKERLSQNIVIKDNIHEDNRLDSIISSYYYINNNIEYVLNKLNNKTIIGVRLESAGRLTRRFKAQRAIKKSKYIGTLKNIDSSIKGLSVQMVRNNKSSSLQFSKAKSSNRIGSFGMKGWINSI